MRLPIPCTACDMQFGRPTGLFSDCEFRDDSCYSLTCSNGHETLTVLQQPRFEILFEIAAYAILDGYYREAVSSFTSGIERFYEYALRVLFEGKPAGAFDACWKLVASQSERQLGAFIFTWAMKFREAPKVLGQRQVEVRNRVIHTGQIPTKADAIEYGNAALELVRPQVRRLQEAMPDEASAFLQRHLRTAAASYKGPNPVSTMFLSTLVNGQGRDAGKTTPSVEEYLLHLAQWSKIVDSTLGPRAAP